MEHRDRVQRARGTAATPTTNPTINPLFLCRRAYPLFLPSLYFTSFLLFNNPYDTVTLVFQCAVYEATVSGRKEKKKRGLREGKKIKTRLGRIRATM